MNMPRFIERLSYANTKRPVTVAKAKTIRTYEGARPQAQFLNLIARRQASMWRQHRRRYTALKGTRPA
jgi:hypothetical protein